MITDALDFGPDESQNAETSIPSFQSSGRMDQTGVALVYEDELIMPASGSEAEIELIGIESEQIVNYYFPVEIAIVGILPEEEHELITTRVWKQLGNVLRRMA